MQHHSPCLIAPPLMSSGKWLPSLLSSEVNTCRTAKQGHVCPEKVMPNSCSQMTKLHCHGTTRSIRKYSSTFYVGMGWVQYGCLYLRYGSSSVITTARQKAFASLLLKMPQEFCYPTQKLRKRNMKISILLSFFLLHHA